MISFLEVRCADALQLPAEHRCCGGLTITCLDALSIPNTFYGVYALIGYVVVISASLFNGFTAKQNGESLSIWFNTWAILMSIVFVWYLTRCGTAFQWW